MTIQFCRIVLRTSDVAAGRAFYSAVVGHSDLDIVQLPEEAAARGARSLWLGHIGVDDVERTVCAFVERGATRLGPTRPTATASEVAIVRDPGGAVIAFVRRSSEPARTGAIWYHLNTPGLDRAVSNYCELFGWQPTIRLDLGTHGAYREFAWQTGGASVGSIADIAGRPGVHPHWLFHFRVRSLDSAMAAIRAAGGLVIAPIVLPDGNRIAVCDDPQGAAFALRE